jgi:[ribosomal protein S5]-alanine N-acetyltransferase
MVKRGQPMYAVLVTDKRIYLYATERVTLRRLAAEDSREFTELVQASADFLGRWVRMPATADKFGEYIKRFDGELAECLLICNRECDAIVGAISISEIIRGPYHRATVGYNTFLPTARQGYMSEGFGLLFRFAFQDLGLHRLEADIQPDNIPSLRLAAKVGFRKEGFSPGFVRIDGKWMDHERWAITSEMPEAEVSFRRDTGG